MVMLKMRILHASGHALVLRGSYYSVVFMGDKYLGHQHRAVCTEQI